MNPVLSLVTGTRNRPGQFATLIDSVIARTVVPWEMIVSDASDTGFSYCDDLPEQVTVISEKPRQGHSRGYNAAFYSTRGEWIIWLNDDAEVCEGYDRAAISFMESHPTIGLGALHYSENGGPFHVNSAWNAMYANFGIFRRDLGLQVGFFDEDIQMYGADNSLAFKILLAGYGIADIPDARILHHSVNDKVRIENQQQRLSDNRILSKKYMPLQKYWLRIYERHRTNDGGMWHHGIEPKTTIYR